MCSEPCAVNLPLSCDEVVQQRNAESAANVTCKITDTGDLVELLPRNAYVVQRADGDKN